MFMMLMVQKSEESVFLGSVVMRCLVPQWEIFVHPEQFLVLVQVANVHMIPSLPFLVVECLHCLLNPQILVSIETRLRDLLMKYSITKIFNLDWKQTVACNTSRDCRDFGVQAECSRVHGGTYGSDGYEYEGWCTPALCGAYSGCPDIGDVCADGMISGSCKVKGKCVYEEVKLQAMCQPEPTPIGTTY